MGSRAVCERTGHKFRDVSGMMAVPFVYCSRWWCSATAVAVWAPAELAEVLHNAIPLEDRYPPVELRDGVPHDPVTGAVLT